MSNTDLLPVNTCRYANVMVITKNYMHMEYYHPQSWDTNCHITSRVRGIVINATFNNISVISW